MSDSTIEIQSNDMNEKRMDELKIMRDSGKKYESEKLLKVNGGFEKFFWDFLSGMQDARCEIG